MVGATVLLMFKTVVPVRTKLLVTLTGAVDEKPLKLRLRAAPFVDPRDNDETLRTLDVGVMPTTERAPPSFTVIDALAGTPAVVIWRVPPLTVVGPVNVLAPVRASVPVPVLVRPNVAVPPSASVPPYVVDELSEPIVMIELDEALPLLMAPAAPCKLANGKLDPFSFKVLPFMMSAAGVLVGNALPLPATMVLTFVPFELLISTAANTLLALGERVNVSVPPLPSSS